MTPPELQGGHALGRMGSAQEAIDEYQSSTSGRSASGRDSEGEWEGPASLSGLYMGQSAPLGRRDIEDVKLSNLVAESPLI